MRRAFDCGEYLEHGKHEDMLQPECNVDDTGKMAEARSSLPFASEWSDERRRQNERGADEIGQTQMLYQDEMRGAQFDGIVTDVVDDTGVGADGEEHQQGQQSRLQRPVQDGHGTSKFHGHGVHRSIVPHLSLGIVGHAIANAVGAAAAAAHLNQLNIQR